MRRKGGGGECSDEWVSNGVKKKKKETRIGRETSNWQID